MASKRPSTSGLGWERGTRNALNNRIGKDKVDARIDYLQAKREAWIDAGHVHGGLAANDIKFDEEEWEGMWDDVEFEREDLDEAWNYYHFD